MKYALTREGIFLDRPNRFIAHVELNGQSETVHVKNTGRCRELLVPGASVILSDGCNSNRKTKYDLIAVDKPGLGWVNIDSQAPNAVMKEWLESGNSYFGSFDVLHPEYSFGQSRMDFYGEISHRRILIEVKGCTLEQDGQGYFPDAPTERGRKHLHELMRAHALGFESYLAYVIAMPKVTTVLPNAATDPLYAETIQEAEKNGVKILFIYCSITTDGMDVTGSSLKQV